MDVAVLDQGAPVVTVELRRPPDNYFDATLVAALAEIVLELEHDPTCRAIVLASEGKNFCAGARLGGDGAVGREALYAAGARLFTGTKPIVAAVQGAAVGGGAGLALVADFRVGAPSSRFSLNFSRLGFFPGFGVTVTLPRVVGHQRAMELLYTGRRVDGTEALRIGLCDRLDDDVRAGALELAGELAGAAPLAVAALRGTFRAPLHAAVVAAMARESEWQVTLGATTDFREGVQAMAERRPPEFQGR